MLIEFEIEMAVKIPLEEFCYAQGDCDLAEEMIRNWCCDQSYDDPDYGYIPADLKRKAAQELVEYQKRHPFNLKLSDIISTAKEGQRYRSHRCRDTYTFKDKSLYEDRYNKKATFTINQIETERFRDIGTEKEEEEEWQPMNIC